VPNIKSAIKRVEISQRRAASNASARSTIKTAIKKFDESLTTNSLEKIQTSFTKAVSLLDRAAQTGLIHRNAVARKKSKLTKKMNINLVVSEKKEVL
jgi:small subunit ribosomal protein S20